MDDLRAAKDQGVEFSKLVLEHDADETLASFDTPVSQATMSTLFD